MLSLRGNLGVYQLADASQQILFIGYAGGKSLFGLKGEILDAFQAHSTAVWARWEVTSAYMSRYKELLMVHRHDHHELPPKHSHSTRPVESCRMNLQLTEEQELVIAMGAALRTG